MNREVSILRKSPLFAGIEPDDIKSMLGCLDASRRKYGKNEILLHSGDIVSSFGIILSGRVHITNDDFWGNCNIIDDAVPGDAFAESYACTEGASLDISVIAAEETEVLYIAVGRVLIACPSACEFHTRLIRNLLSVIARKNIMMNRKLTHLTRRTTREKLLSFLSAESARRGSAAFDIHFNRQQLADYLSVDRSAMSAELCRMRNEGLLEFDKNHFILSI